MKTKNIIYLAFAMLVALSFVPGCGKSGKEVKMISSEKTGETKTASQIFKVDTVSSSMNWVGKKVTGQHNGTIKISGGEVGIDKSGLVVAGNFEMNMKSINNLDLDDAGMNNKLINHLKSEDFFSAEKFPTSKFEITKVETLSDPAKPNFNNTVSGNLTIKGITKSISFPASIKIENGALSAFADFEIDRTQWEIKYGSGKFFENLGDKMINDNFNISFKLIAK
jgi:polyisoprenoid-binding protein YceI